MVKIIRCLNILQRLNTDLEVCAVICIVHLLHPWFYFSIQTPSTFWLMQNSGFQICFKFDFMKHSEVTCGVLVQLQRWKSHLIIIVYSESL